VVIKKTSNYWLFRWKQVRSIRPLWPPKQTYTRRTHFLTDQYERVETYFWKACWLPLWGSLRWWAPRPILMSLNISRHLILPDPIGCIQVLVIIASKFGIAPGADHVKMFRRRQSIDDDSKQFDHAKDSLDHWFVRYLSDKFLYCYHIERLRDCYSTPQDS